MTTEHQATEPAADPTQPIYQVRPQEQNPGTPDARTVYWAERTDGQPEFLRLPDGPFPARATAEAFVAFLEATPPGYWLKCHVYKPTRYERLMTGQRGPQRLYWEATGHLPGDPDYLDVRQDQELAGWDGRPPRLEDLITAVTEHAAGAPARIAQAAREAEAQAQAAEQEDDAPAPRPTNAARQCAGCDTWTTALLHDDVDGDLLCLDCWDQSGGGWS